MFLFPCLRLSLLTVALVLSGSCKEPAKPPTTKSTEETTAEETQIGSIAVTEPPSLPNPPIIPPAPAGIPSSPKQTTNPTTREKVALGRLLFFDPRLSQGKELSCGDCHQPSRVWTDGKDRSKTAKGVPNLRHTPTLANLVFHTDYFWDGRGSPLEAMIAAHWRGQMAKKPSSVVENIAEIPRYRAHFRRAFDAPPSAAGVRDALTAYVRTLFLGDSPWDRYEAGDKNAVSDEVVLGFTVFTKRAGCGNCHTPPLYTDMKFHKRRPVSDDDPDTGRFRVTQRPDDHGAFKTPTLRGTVSSAPYFHDGSQATLEAAIKAEMIRQQLTQPLTDPEMAALVAFVRSLSGTAPKKPTVELPRSTTPKNANSGQGLGVGFPSILEQPATQNP